MMKIFVYPFIRAVVYLLIGFFVSRHMLAEDVARKLYAGDNVELFNGAWTINVKQIVDFLIMSIVPAIIPLALAIRSQIVLRYRALVAAITPREMSPQEVKTVADQTSLLQQAKTLINENRKNES